MFDALSLTEELATLRDDVAPAVRVVETEQEFETMPTEWLFELALITDDLHPLAHPDTWVPAEALPAARRTTERDPTIGMPDDGSVSWTRQTDPSMVFVKPRASGLPETFRDLLIGEALIEVSGDYPETPVCFFQDAYRSVQEAVGSPTVAFQLAAALRTGWIGRETRDVFQGWESSYPALYDGWVDAGERLEGRVNELSALMAADELSIADATELACNAIKHDIPLPAPFAAIDVDAYTEQGAPFARRWIEETAVDALQQ